MKIALIFIKPSEVSVRPALNKLGNRFIGQGWISGTILPLIFNRSVRQLAKI